MIGVAPLPLPRGDAARGGRVECGRGAPPSEAGNGAGGFPRSAGGGERGDGGLPSLPGLRRSEPPAGIFLPVPMCPRLSHIYHLSTAGKIIEYPKGLQTKLSLCLSSEQNDSLF